MFLLACVQDGLDKSTEGQMVEWDENYLEVHANGTLNAYYYYGDYDDSYNKY